MKIRKIQNALAIPERSWRPRMSTKTVMNIHMTIAKNPTITMNNTKSQNDVKNIELMQDPSLVRGLGANTHRLVAYNSPSWHRQSAPLFGLDWRDHVEVDPALYRPSELRVGRANPRKAREELGWEARYRMKDVVRMMMDAAAPASNHEALA